MGIKTSVGAIVQIAKTFAASKAITQITNANPAVATLDDETGLANGDYIVLDETGWDAIKSGVFRVANLNGGANTIELEGLDTSDTDLFPGGATAAAGSLREITAWETVQQIQNVGSDAPQPEFADITTLADRNRKKIPTFTTYPTVNLTIFYDEALAYVAVLRSVSNRNTLTPLKVQLQDGTKILANAYWKTSDFPQLNSGAPVTKSCSISLQCDATVYAS